LITLYQKEVKSMALDKPKKDETLKRALQKLADIRVIVEGLRGHEDEYAVVENQLEEIERILDA